MGKSAQIDTNSIQEKIADLHGVCEELVAEKPAKSLQDIPTEKECGKLSGVYLFTENGKHMYVGRSRNIRARYSGHRANNEHSGSFAFLLTREIWKKLGRDINKTRKELMNIDAFKKLHKEMTKRIGRMEFRYVKESDDTTQAFLEIYCAVALNTKYNSFETH